MEKFKAWIKRPVNINFIILMLISLAILAFAVFGLISSRGLTRLLSNLKELIETAEGGGEVDDVKGYAVILGWLVYAVVSFGNGLVKAVTVYIPLITALFTAVHSLFARLVFAPQGGRLTLYRVSICLCLLTLAAPFVLYTLFSLFEPSYTAIMLAADTIIVTASVICIRNTYTDRIKQ